MGGSNSGKQAQANADAVSQQQRKDAQAAEAKITQAGQPTQEETQRLGTYTQKSQAPAENLLTEAGPISQAVSQRILERTQNPGMDYNTNEADFRAGITDPLWRGLKSRGIAPPPGSEGGGLGTQQYMKGAAPALAELRSNQINTDINRGQAYNTAALGQQNYYTNILENLSNAIRQRQYGGATQGATTGYEGASKANDITLGGMNANTDYQAAQQKQMSDALGQALTLGLSALLTGGTATAAKTATKASTDVGLNSMGNTPYDRMLAKLAKGE